MKRIISAWNILLILILISGASCKKETDPHFIKLETANGNQVDDILVVEAKGLTQTFQLKSNGSWRIALSSGNPTWIAIHPSSGNQNGSFSLAIETNTEASSREAELAFTVNGQQLAVLKIKQEGLIKDPVVTSFNPLLDLLFTQDGTAEDGSEFKHPISSLEGFALSTQYDNTFKRYIARFNHNDGSATPTGYYKIDYASNQSFKNAIADGHTLEAMFMSDVNGPMPNREVKMFSSHEGGGTGLMIGNDSRNNAIIFLPNVGSGYVWTSSGITPERGKYYHVVGVWNKQEGKTYIYVNGELKGSATTSGDFKFPTAGSDWFGVGADPAGTAAGQAGWKGDVSIARIYDKPLDAAEVEQLWKQVEVLTPAPDDIKISGVSLVSKLVQANSDYTINGEGFLAGDRVKLVPVATAGSEYQADGVATSNSLTFKIPADFATGRYRFLVLRGSKTLDLGFATLTRVTATSAPKIIAHRGYWKTGAPQNSIAALVKAQEIGIYGAEVDIYITADGKLVLNHDATINGIRIETSTYDQLKDITLSNGEKLPTLEDFMIQGKKDPSTKLILEIKTHSSSTNGVSNNERAAKAIVELVNQMNMKDQVEYIAFSIDVCKFVLKYEPNALVAYLNGNLTPQNLHNQGIKGIDYTLAVIRQNPTWIAQAHQLGMTVNVWTLNSQADLQEAILLGVDFITTDEPVLAKSLVGGT